MIHLMAPLFHNLIHGSKPFRPQGCALVWDKLQKVEDRDYLQILFICNDVNEKVSKQLKISLTNFYDRGNCNGRNEKSSFERTYIKF